MYYLLLFLQIVHQLIAMQCGLGEAVVLSPSPEAGSHRRPAGNQLLQLLRFNGQYGLACCAQELVCQRQTQHGGSGNGGGGNAQLAA